VRAGSVSRRMALSWSRSFTLCWSTRAMHLFHLPFDARYTMEGMSLWRASLRLSGWMWVGADGGRVGIRAHHLRPSLRRGLSLGAIPASCVLRWA
jgi:hypothetical protein